LRTWSKAFTEVAQRNFRVLVSTYESAPRPDDGEETEE
jgi:hypothetical protein